MPCRTRRSAWGEVSPHALSSSFHLSSFAMRCTVPVPMPSDLTTFKIPMPFASCFRTLRSVTLSIVEGAAGLNLVTVAEYPTPSANCVRDKLCCNKNMLLECC